jgi:hypothetical protein
MGQMDGRMIGEWDKWMDAHLVKTLQPIVQYFPKFTSNTI